MYADEMGVTVVLWHVQLETDVHVYHVAENGYTPFRVTDPTDAVYTLTATIEPGPDGDDAYRLENQHLAAVERGQIRA
jgi:hypothetical protein